MYSSSKIPQDDDTTNHKIKALELTATQFSAQLKPLFNENTKLKQQLIALNFYVEERKLQLSSLISDAGPNGEDRVLVKAVADFKQICDILEEDITRLHRQIEENNETKTSYQLMIKQLKEQIEVETERHFTEKQSLIDQNRRQSQYFKSIQTQNEAKIDKLQMKIEDLQSQIMQVRLREQSIHQAYRVELDQKTAQLNLQIQQLCYEKHDQMEKFEVERRSYLSQLEIFSTKLNQAKLELINEYEYKLQSQKIKLDNQFQKAKDESVDYKQQLSAVNEKNKILQQQIDKYSPYVNSLEKDVQDLKYRIFVGEEQLKGKDSKILQQGVLIDQLNEQIKRLKSDKIQPRDTSKRQSQNNSKQTSPDKLVQKQQLQQTRQNYVTKYRDPMKQGQGSNPESKVQSSQKRTSVQKDEFLFEETTIEQYVENNKQDIQQTQQSSVLQSRQSLDDQQTQQIALIKIVENDNVQPLEESRQIQLYNKSLQTTQRVWVMQLEKGTQCDQLNYIGIEDQNLQEKPVDYQILRLQNELMRLKDNYEEQLNQQQNVIKDLKKQLELQDVRFEQAQEELLRQQQSNLQSKQLEANIIICDLKQKLKEKDERIKGFLNSEQLFETLIEELNDKQSNHDKEIEKLQKNHQNEIAAVKQESSIELKRLLQLNEQLKDQHLSEIESLNNQHLLDQEQLQQLKKRLQDERNEYQNYIRQTTDLLEQAKSKESLLDSYRRELLKTNEIVKYLSLEIENFKKVNNIFRSKNDSITQSFLYNGMGFLPTEVQDKIKQRFNKVKYKTSIPTTIQRDAYAMNFSLQKGSKMKHAKLTSMNGNMLDQKVLNKQENKFKLERLNELNQSLPKIQVQEYERSHSDRKRGVVNKNYRSKTQQEDYVETSDPKRIIQDINQKELLLIQRSQMLLSQLNHPQDTIEKQKGKQQNKSAFKI